MAAWDTNVGSKAPSPMEPFKNGLRVLKYVGLPLEFNHDATEFTEKGRLLKCILIPGGESIVQGCPTGFCSGLRNCSVCCLRDYFLV